VMKNVAGFDISRVLCGSLGILGLITEVSLRVLPAPRAQQTFRFRMGAQQAINSFNQWCAEALPVSATAWLDGEAWVRLSGSTPAVRAAEERLLGLRLDDARLGVGQFAGELVEPATAAAWWQSVRNQTHSFFTDAASLWRFSLPATAAPLNLEGAELIEWNGALRWLRTDNSGDELRSRAVAAGGTALHWRGAISGRMFHPVAPAIVEIHRRLKQRFDPHAIFNPGRLIEGL
jgi:glycolate oxidase FAD binding subunit